MATGTEQQGDPGIGAGEAQEQDILGPIAPEIDNYEPDAEETPYETARKIAHLLDAHDDNGQEGQGQQTQEKTARDTAPENGQITEHAQNQKQAAQNLEKQDASSDTDLAPPAIIRNELKQAFAKLPDEFKREANRIFKTIQANGTRTQQQLTESLKQSEGIINSASRYIQDNGLVDPNTKQFYSPNQLFTELMQAHSAINKDPDRAIANMIMNMNANPENIALYLQGKNPSGVDLRNDPNYSALQNEVNQLKNELGSYREIFQQQQRQPAINEYSQVMNEVDADGNLRYPELQNQHFLNATGPIVADLLRTGQYTPGEALREAYAEILGRRHSQQSTQQPITQQQPRSINFQERARNAAISVRGRIPPAGSDRDPSDDLELSEIPDSPTETARLLARRLSGG
jgi:hypothetical protein